MKKLVLICSIILASSSLFGQVNVNLWTNFSIEKELSKKFEIGAAEELRLADNITQFNQVLTEVGFKYKFNKYYHIGLEYRFSYKSNQSFGNRLTLSNRAKYKVEDVTFNYRLNLQTDFNTKEAIEYKIRNRLGIDYKFNKHWEIGVTGELFYSFYYNKNLLDQYRVAFNVDHKINKHHKIGPSIMFQQEMNVANPKSDLILSFGYKYTI